MDDLVIWRRLCGATAWLGTLVEHERDGEGEPSLAEVRASLTAGQYTELARVARDVTMARRRAGLLQPERLGELLAALAADAFSLHLSGEPVARVVPVGYLDWTRRVLAVAEDIERSHLRVAGEALPALPQREPARVIPMVARPSETEATPTGGEAVDLGTAGRRPRDERSERWDG